MTYFLSRSKPKVQPSRRRDASWSFKMSKIILRGYFYKVSCVFALISHSASPGISTQREFNISFWGEDLEIYLKLNSYIYRNTNVMEWIFWDCRLNPKDSWINSIFLEHWMTLRYLVTSSPWDSWFDPYFPPFFCEHVQFSYKSQTILYAAWLLGSLIAAPRG